MALSAYWVGTEVIEPQMGVPSSCLSRDLRTHVASEPWVMLWPGFAESRTGRSWCELTGP